MIDMLLDVNEGVASVSFIRVITSITTPQDAHKRLVLQVYLC